MNCDDIIDNDITTEEIQVALRKLKPRKASGVNGLQSEHPKHVGHLLILWLRQVFNAFIAFECVPPCILTGIVQPIYKRKTKDPLSCDSYRGISITPAIMKLFEYILLVGNLGDSSGPIVQQSLCSSQDWVNYFNIYSHTPQGAARFCSVSYFLFITA